MTRYMVVEISRRRGELLATEFATREEAEEERYILARTARLCWPDLGYRYEVREVES